MPCGVMHSRSACIINMSQRERAHQAESTLGAGVIITTDGKQDRIKGQKLTVGGCKKINNISVRGGNSSYSVFSLMHTSSIKS